jgi:hypothetical protein
VITEASPNLAQWAAVATYTVFGTGFELLDPPTQARPAQFFRARLRP